MTTEEKVKAYDKAIKKAESLYKAAEPMSGCNVIIETLFPELKKSEDEKIMKELIEFVRNRGGFKQEWILWLEKQAQKPQVKSALEAAKEEKVNNQNCVKSYAQEHIGDNIEPKFHEGDWITDGNITIQIEAIKNDCYLYCGDCVLYSTKTADKVYHLWTIQDAKDGDVLMSRAPFIYGKPIPYGGLDWYNGKFIKASNYVFKDSPVHPATKEQCDTLFAKMKEAGYEWDAEKKELKKIEHKHICELDNSYACVKFPFKAKVKSSGAIVTIHGGQLSLDGKEWIKYQSDKEDGYSVYELEDLEPVCDVEPNSAWSEEDEDILKTCLYFFNGGKGGISDNRRDNILNWFKSLKDRVLPKQEWSEEDSNMIANIRDIVFRCAYLRSAVDVNGDLCEKEYIDADYWLKSLRNRVQPQNTWKPSDEQMEALKEACDEHWEPDGLDPLYTLWEQPKKLREE